MSEVEVQASATPVGKGKKGEKKTSKHAKPTHPPTSDMVNMAIKGLKERSGSSLQAIKKYIAANYKVDPEKMAPFIKKYLKSAVQSGSLVQTKGKTEGAETQESGDRRGRGRRHQEKKKVAAKVASSERSKTAAATAVKAKKPAGEKKAKAPKSPSKAKKTAKSPTKKPKAPKPKTVKTAAASSKAKKVASPKRRNKRRSTNGGVTFIDAKQESALLRAPHS
ncbi:hypothetical protein HHI36_024301 [Cryptolaemus montrouzieri]|uniref:H15 domain-containing protein n=1 Tax=Cryptolaemus montrouzieri TaxID=559131 RepID=A0ABD2MN03_9CUCU